MLTRREVLTSLGWLGAVLAVPPVLAGCGETAASRRVGAGGSSPGLALANVSRDLGGAQDRPAAVAAVQAFTADLYRQLAAEQGNIVCSPYSVAVALAMTRAGARGRTGAEMDAVLHSPGAQTFDQGLSSLTRLIESRAGRVERFDGSHATISLDVANSLWGQRGTTWERPFLERLARYYGTGMRLVDYIGQTDKARTLINGWTADMTHDRIPEIIPPDILDELTRLVLVNAIYLKAPWEETFLGSMTKPQPFTRGDGSRVDADMMSGSLSLASFGAGPGWRAARLPYAGGELAMTVVVPDGSLTQLEGSLDADRLAAMLAVPRPVDALVLHLPKWRFRLAPTLNDPLKALGMPTAFDFDRAEFSAMTTEGHLYIKAVLHQAFIAVDEHGTEAAAATAVIMDDQSAGPPPVILDVDRPFLFVIHDVETATPLFIGRVDDPTTS
ncbi:MAG: serpin family protein [Nocardioidaceae bacterium]